MIQEVDIFLNVNDFAQAAILTPDGGTAINCSVNFIPENAEITVGDLRIPNDAPKAEIKSSVIGSTKKGTLKIGTYTWYIIDVGPDMNGLTLVSISRYQKS